MPARSLSARKVKLAVLGRGWLESPRMTHNPYKSPPAHAEADSSSTPHSNPTSYSVSCVCGSSIPVLASDAGGSVRCRCGRDVSVPRLSLLRAAQGLAAYETNLRDTIARKIAEGMLPPDLPCAVTGLPADDVMWFDVHCETTYRKGSTKLHIVALVMLALVSWPLALLMRSLGFGASRDVDRLGRDIVVGVPLKVRTEARPQLKGWITQKRLRQLLGAVPEYQQLLAEYPTARIYPR